MDLYVWLLVFLFLSGLMNSMEVSQIPCTGFGRKSMIGDGKDSWNYQKYMMDLLSLILWWSKPKFKLLGIIVFKSPNYYWYNFMLALLFGNGKVFLGQSARHWLQEPYSAVPRIRFGMLLHFVNICSMQPIFLSPPVLNCASLIWSLSFHIHAM